MAETLEQTREWRHFEAVLNEANGVAAEGILAAYRAVRGRPGRAKARKMIEDEIMTANRMRNTARATMLSDVRANLRQPREKPLSYKRRKAKAQMYVEHTAAVQLAFAMMATHPPDDIVPMLKPDWYEQLPTDTRAAEIYRAWLLDPLSGPEPVVDDLDRKAAKISVGKAPGNSGRPLSIRLAAPREPRRTPPTGSPNQSA